MAGPPPDDIEELALCSCCAHVFDDAERTPKLLACKHHFCLDCTRGVLSSGGSARCLHCGQCTELPLTGATALRTHAAVLALARRLLPVHASESRHDASLLAADLRRLIARRCDFLQHALDATGALKLRLETELAASPSLSLASASPTSETLASSAGEFERLRAHHADALLQCRLDDLVRQTSVPLDFELLHRTMTGIATLYSAPASSERRDPVLFLANFCMAQLYSRAYATRRAEVDTPASNETAKPSGPTHAVPLSAHPLFYFQLEVNGKAYGRVVVSVRDDVAPRMARNFCVLATGELGVGYRGCSVFQCWDGESVITGDFELNNGRGGRSVFEEGHFMPDDTGLAAVRGAVGMRRSQKRRDHLGLVGSQFRIVLREMRGFTAIFAHVVEGLELVDRLSRTGDGTGKPNGSILISGCGRLN